MFLSILETIGIILLVILFFNIMIFVHELGHFLAGKWRGAYIDRFQIWFGKPLWKKKIWGVEWGLGWIPAGGFVSLPQMEDMAAIEGEAHADKESLKPLSALDKVIIAAAGPLFSLLLAYVFAVMVFIVGKPTTSDPGTTIGYVLPDSPAAQAGLLPGDRITAIDGKKVDKWMGNMEGVMELIAMSEFEKITLAIARPQEGGSEQELEIQTGYTVPESKWWQRSKLRKVGILKSGPLEIEGVLPNSPAECAGVKPGQKVTALNGHTVYTLDAVTLCSKEGKPFTLTLSNPDGSTEEVTISPELPANWQGKKGAIPLSGISWKNGLGPKLEYPGPQEQVNYSLKFMGDTLAKLCAPGSNVGMQHLSGPVGIGNYMYQMMASGDGMGWRLVLWFAVVLNVNLAVLNILPLPVVDGGHVVLGIAEMIFHRPVSGKFLNWIFLLFIILLAAFFLFVTTKDIGDMIGGDKADKLPDPVFSAPAE